MIPKTQMTGKRAFCFVTLTFALTYAAWGFLALNPGELFPFGSLQAMIPFVIGGCSPAIIMFVLIKKWGKTREERTYFKPIFRTSHGWKPTVCITSLFFISYLLISFLLTERIAPWYMLIVLFPVMIVGGGLEEIGWRGFFQPALEKKMPFWLAAFIVGVIWGVWHFPLRFIPGTFQENINFPLYIGFTILMSFLLGAIQRLTGSVAASIAFHAWANVVVSVFSLNLLLEGENSPFLFALLLIGLSILSTIAVYIYKFKSKDVIK